MLRGENWAVTISLSPELEADLRHRAAIDGVAPEDLVSRAVGFYLKAQLSPARQVAGKDRKQEMSWVANPDPKYFGLWVVLEGDQVIAKGESGKAAYDEAIANGVESPFLIFVSPSDNEPFVAGWLG